MLFGFPRHLDCPVYLLSPYLIGYLCICLDIKVPQDLLERCCSCCCSLLLGVSSYLAYIACPARTPCPCSRVIPNPMLCDVFVSSTLLLGAGLSWGRLHTILTLLLRLISRLSALLYKNIAAFYDYFHASWVLLRCSLPSTPHVSVLIV